MAQHSARTEKNDWQIYASTLGNKIKLRQLRVSALYFASKVWFWGVTACIESIPTSCLALLLTDSWHYLTHQYIRLEMTVHPCASPLLCVEFIVGHLSRIENVWFWVSFSQR